VLSRCGGVHVRRHALRWGPGDVRLLRRVDLLHAPVVAELVVRGDPAGRPPRRRRLRADEWHGRIWGDGVAVLRRGICRCTQEAGPDRPRTMGPTTTRLCRGACVRICGVAGLSLPTAGGRSANESTCVLKAERRPWMNFHPENGGNEGLRLLL